ncbi:ABC transporter substrate-binding protein [Leeia sp. TBRC 13508]|uniref:ABC transporter substrate-binding protein n=1 Tax=Leeia speluncae TaxID=2884804 RepID=A0ABS8D696_9NEIS|nr:ABC transporter substrate-binding protein [Leeia speluncae]MCB6183720.1 ABC transporter substrate-binding protein [Leeia speluncae]
MRIKSFLLILLLVSHSIYAKTLVVGVTSWIGVAPLSVAEAKGYWKEQGLSVEIKKYTLYEDLFRDYKNRKVDVLYDMTGTWVDLSLQGVPITLLAETDWSNGSDKVIIKQSLKQINTLKGKEVGIYLNKSSVTFFLHTFLKQHGLSLSDVKLKELDGEPLAKAFIQNQFPLIVLYDPPALTASNQGKGYVVADTSDYPGVMPEGFAIHPDSLNQFGDETLAKFFGGWIKARQWMAETDDWKTLGAILNKKTFAGEPAYDSLELIGMLNSIKFHSRSTLLQRNKDGGGMSIYLQQLTQFLRETGKLQKNLNLDTLVNTRAIMMALSR